MSYRPSKGMGMDGLLDLLARRARRGARNHGSLWLFAVGAAISLYLPCGTLLINIFGSLLIGFWNARWLAEVSGLRAVAPFVMVGICGGFTTFSAFSLQTLDLLRSGAWIRAMLNIVLSVVLCVGR